VFVIGHSGSWQRAAAVLFDRESLRGNSPPRREAGKTVAGTIGSRTTGGGGLGTDFDLAGGLQPVAPTINAAFGSKLGLDNQHIDSGAGLFVRVPNCNHEQPILAFNLTFCDSNGTRKDRPNGGLYVNEADTSHSLTCVNPGVATLINAMQASTDRHAVAFAQNTRDEVREMSVVGALAAQPGMKQTSYLRQGMQVRRLTPAECAKLQGFPDNFLSQVPGASDTAMYRALGNSMAVNCMALLGERIQMVESI